MKVEVIGAGVIGLCSAYYLAKDGHEVTVYDPGDGPKTSTVNAGMIVPSHVIPLASPGMVALGLRMMLRRKSPFWIRPRLDRKLLRWAILFARHCSQEHVDRSKTLLVQLNLASKKLYLDLRAELPGFQIEQKGLLMVAGQAQTLEEERHVADQVRGLGLSALELSSSEIASFDPGIRIQAAGGIHYPEDCHFSPPQFMALLEETLVRMGVRFVYDRRHPGEELTVLAAGAWSATIADQLGVHIPLQAGKGYSFTIEQPPERPTIASILMEGRVAVTPIGDGVRFGGTMEIGPLDAHVDEGRVEGIREAIPNYYPAFHHFDFPRAPVGVGLRPCTPDGLPYIGVPREHRNLIIATGHAMMGMSLGPISGKIVSDIVAGRPPTVDVSRLSPDRFAR